MLLSRKNFDAPKKGDTSLKKSVTKFQKVVSFLKKVVTKIFLRETFCWKRECTQIEREFLIKKSKGLKMLRSHSPVRLN